MKRYSVCKFPSYLGTPWRTDKFLVAVVYALLRSVFGFSIDEVRVIDKKTGEHPIVW